MTQAPSDRMLAAVPPGTTVRFDTRNGACVHEGEPLVTLWPVPADAEAARNRLAATVVVASTRTMQEDVDFAIRQLVDIGLRALNSAINDPTTAVEVTLRLGSLLRKLFDTELPPRTVAGAEGRVLLRPWDLSHDGYVAHALDQLRQAAPSQSQVVATLLRVLRMLAVHAGAAGGSGWCRCCRATATACWTPSGRRGCTRRTSPGWRPSHTRLGTRSTTTPAGTATTGPPIGRDEPDGQRRGSPPTSLPVIGNFPRRELTGHCRVRGR